MKPLVLCYSFTGNTKKICGNLAKALGADFVELKEITHRNKFSAFTSGLLKARQRKSSDIRPVLTDLARYDCLIVATPIWGGSVTPAMNDFLREYDIQGKKVYGLIVCYNSPKGSAQMLQEEIEKQGAVCPNVLVISRAEGHMEDLKSGIEAFAIDEQDHLVLKKGTVQ
jgi:flavodoxin